MRMANNTPTLAHLETKFTWVEDGGEASPRDCVPRTNVAIVVPFRLVYYIITHYTLKYGYEGTKRCNRVLTTPYLMSSYPPLM